MFYIFDFDVSSCSHLLFSIPISTARQVVQGHDKAPGDAVKEFTGKSSDINDGFGGKYVSMHVRRIVYR